MTTTTTEAKPAAKGLECRKCGCTHFLTADTVPLPGGKIRRYRRCRHCGRSLTTVETVETRPPKVAIRRE